MREVSVPRISLMTLLYDDENIILDRPNILRQFSIEMCDQNNMKLSKRCQNIKRAAL